MAMTLRAGGGADVTNPGPDFYAVVAAILAVVLLVDISLLWVTGRAVPELLSQLIFGIFGFYFGRAPVLERTPKAEPPAGGAAGGGSGDREQEVLASAGVVRRPVVVPRMPAPRIPAPVPVRTQGPPGARSGVN